MSHVPYEPHPIGGIQCEGGQSVCVTVRAPSRGLLQKLVVAQMSGSDQGFTVESFSAEDACAGASESDSEGADTGKVHPVLFRVHPPITAAEGVASLFAQPGYVFVNQEEINSKPKSAMYVKISANGSGSKEFSLTAGFSAFSGG